MREQVHSKFLSDFLRLNSAKSSYGKLIGIIAADQCIRLELTSREKPGSQICAGAWYKKLSYDSAQHFGMFKEVLLSAGMQEGNRLILTGSFLVP